MAPNELLPGGLIENGVRARDYAFRAVDGALELTLSEITTRAANMPEAVSLSLEAALRNLADGPPSRERIDALCIADRQFLMRELACRMGHCGDWFNARCARCGEHFDFQLNYADLPVKPAGPDFPYIRLRLSASLVTVRQPTGADQLRLLRAVPEKRRLHLLGALLTTDEGAEVDVERLSAAEIDAIENALETSAPAVVCEVIAPCPQCSEANGVGVNPYSALGQSEAALLQDVHRLAWYYHWSEADILALPKTRRTQYLRLIDAARGMTQ